MKKLKLSVFDEYKAVDETAVNGRLARSLQKLGRKIVVLDDDPTGVQTVHGVHVYTNWDKPSLTAGFQEENSIFFVLTNSRGFSTAQTAAVHNDIGKTIPQVSAETGRDYVLISRSDSTMRGHYPLETKTLRKTIEENSSKRFHGEIIIPFFKEGGRCTIDNVHYVKESDQLTPAGETEFAKDKSFGYKSSHIGDYVEEKTKGEFKSANCAYVSLKELRNLEIEKITAKLTAIEGFNKVVVNAIDYVDVKIFAIAYIEAVLTGKEFMFRSAAAMTKVLGGIGDQPLLVREQLITPENQNGGIVLIGSHVNKTTRQFEALKDCREPMEFIEFNQHLVSVPNGLENEAKRVTTLVEETIKSGKNTTVYTRRERFDPDTDNKDEQIKVSTKISDAVSSIIGKLGVRPNFIIAKGGITSSDVGTKALSVKKALVMGQIKPGIPVWMTGVESKFPHMPFVIFPGNVGDVTTLREIVDLLSER